MCSHACLQSFNQLIKQLLHPSAVFFSQYNRWRRGTLSTVRHGASLAGNINGLNRNGRIVPELNEVLGVIIQQYP
jgi:hypothetical protein